MQIFFCVFFNMHNAPKTMHLKNVENAILLYIYAYRKQHIRNNIFQTVHMQACKLFYIQARLLPHNRQRI